MYMSRFFKGNVKVYRDFLEFQRDYLSILSVSQQFQWVSFYFLEIIKILQHEILWYLFSSESVEDFVLQRLDWNEFG